MNDRDDHNGIAIQPVDKAVPPDDELANRGITEFGHDTPEERVRHDPIHRITDACPEPARSGYRAGSDILDDVPEISLG